MHGGVAILYVLPVLKTTSSDHKMIRNRRRERGYGQSDSTGGSTDFTPWRIGGGATQTDPPVPAGMMYLPNVTSNV